MIKIILLLSIVLLVGCDNVTTSALEFKDHTYVHFSLRGADAVLHDPGCKGEHK